MVSVKGDTCTGPRMEAHVAALPSGEFLFPCGANDSKLGMGGACALSSGGEGMGLIPGPPRAAPHIGGGLPGLGNCPNLDERWGNQG